MKIDNLYEATADEDILPNTIVVINNGRCRPISPIDGLNVEMYCSIGSFKKGGNALLAGKDTVFHIQEDAHETN